jgi:glycosyltransferase involved in cell wall biosynthesis
MKNVLIITFYYPPGNNGAVQRPSKFVKYLPHFGYNPIVVTAGGKKLPSDGENIHRFPNDASWARSSQFAFLVFRFIRKSSDAFWLLYDCMHWWYMNTIKSIHKRIDLSKIDLVFCTYRPLSALMIGVYLKQRYGIPLISDFRDGLVFEPLKKDFFIRNIIHKHYEKKVINNSNYIITVSEPITEYFKSAYKLEKALTITNGFDEDDLSSSKNETIERQENDFRIVYTGRISLSRQGLSINPFVDILKEIRELSNPKKKLKLIIAGELMNSEEKYIRKKLQDTFEYKGLLPRQEALKCQKSADLLLLIAGEGTSVVTGKLFEYISSGIPIFALTEGTAAEEIIKETRTGLCVNPNNLRAIRTYLIDIILNNNLAFFSPSREKIAKYSRMELTRLLAGVFDRLIQNKTSFLASNI